ncbi:MAG: tetratricopeptide repeat protein [Deltaproteobacteria bacterium]|nr:tetratricopeptide repeat protein [Deltaproteobacteria bacterium]
MKVRKKITKKKLKQPDEFLTLTEKTYLFIGQHIKKIAIGSILVLILFLSFFLYRMWDQKKEDEANQKFVLALEAYQMVSSPYREGSPAEYKKVLEAFDEVIKIYARTSSGRFSLIYKGGIHLRLGEFDEAINAYEGFLKNGGKEKLYQLFAFEGLGYGYEGKKDYEKALKAYQEIIKLGEKYDWAGVHLNIARCYEKMGKKNEALENYKAFLKASPKSLSTNSVLKKVSSLEK